MGFISNIAGTISDSINSEINDQYLESFRTDSLGQDTLVRRAYRQNSRGRNQGSSDVITAGSKVLVPEGTYALMIDEGKIAAVGNYAELYESCAEFKNLVDLQKLDDANESENKEVSENV
jgi:membrane protease subunit (stomatin/prohibitin family)